MEKTNGGNLIQIKNLVATVNLNNGDTLVTVNKANMELKRGNSYAIVGKSGSGKTSLISIIGLLNHSYQGEFLYNGMSVSTLTDSQLSMLRASNIGFVFQNYSLIKHLRVWENIELPLSSLEQRTHELLIRRAIGASRANIVTLVLGTQLIISIFVCIASILLSLLIVEGISVLLPPDSPITAPSYPIFSAVIAVITSVIVALLGGLLPAIKAAKLEPALALR